MRRVLPALIFVAAGAVVLAHGNNPPEYIGDWIGHRDAAYWADQQSGIQSPEAIAVVHAIAATMTVLPRPGLWALAGIYAAFGALLWISVIGANVAEVARAETAVVELFIPVGMMVAYIVLVVMLYRRLLGWPGSHDRNGRVTPVSDSTRSPADVPR